MTLDVVEIARLFQTDRPDAVAQALDAGWARGRRTYPSVDIDTAVWARHVARHGPFASPDEIVAIHAEDLYLALGCGTGDAAALASFENEHLRNVPLFVAHLRLDASVLDELAQALRVRLLGPRADGPKILQYSGKGPLGGWLRIAAVRVALSLKTAEDHHPVAPTDAAVATGTARADPELALARRHLSQQFKTAFERALAACGAREQAVLRMHYVDGLNVDQIGAVYAVHRATAARWLAAARDEVAAATRRCLRDLLGVGQHDLDSALRLVDSQLDLSLHRLLGGPSAVDEE